MSLTLNKNFNIGASGATDPDFSNVKVLLGSSGSASTFNDLSGNSTSFVLIGNPEWSTGVTPKFGSAAIHFDGNDSLEFADATTDLTADWTVEFWVYPSTWSSVNIFCKSQTSTGFEVSSNGGSTTRYIAYGGNGGSWTTVEDPSTTLSTGAWQYSAISYKASTTALTMWLGTSGTATQLASSTVSSGIADPADDNFIGSNRGTQYFLNGYLQEFRWTQGVCRYEAGDTVAVPTSEFPRS